MTHSSSSDFDSRARTWDDDTAKRERARSVADAIAARVPALSGSRVLEYGAGTGLLGLALQPLVAEVTLADSSREMLAVAQEKIAARGLRNARTLHLDLAAGPPPELRFDLICTLMTLHHIPDTDGILGAFRELLPKAGAVCIADLDREDGSFHGPGFSGHNGFDRAELRARLEHGGFRNVKIDLVAEVRKDTAAGPRIYPVFLAIAEKA
ncbi:class I SAM-dependent methyltransferase [Anaeromyxobacter sp. Fw109-5]|uniref:class I SAM-dependent DNA methyltransferase n=1 Tax=Anaeromyxobacter sp. (strain Fw109-5) TaxID=404589 RepID=UPI0000ED6EC7|nr:class I SAM-dependent methyltransferase [Anaeromyxobacter sp. Fw109-5]ABS28217.1 Methyltransferase type 12 [Anaeromyxobacter sp. Fw109-5]